MRNLKIITIDNRVIVIGGIGRMFYENGFPISIAVSELAKHGYEVSLLHAADECIKNGWSPETTARKLKDDFADFLDKKESIDISLLETFCYSSYDVQRKMIFKYLFENVENAREWFKNNIDVKRKGQ